MKIFVKRGYLVAFFVLYCLFRRAKAHQRNKQLLYVYNISHYYREAFFLKQKKTNCLASRHPEYYNNAVVVVFPKINLMSAADGAV